MKHEYYSQRIGENKYIDGLPLEDIKGLFLKVYEQFREDGYFDESFGWQDGEGAVRDIEMEILLSIRKKDLWPMAQWLIGYSEDDLFDVVEFLYQYVSKPVEGTYQNYYERMHWATFNKTDGQQAFRSKVNDLLDVYENRFELSDRGEVLRRPEAGFEKIFEASMPAKDENIVDRVDVAILRFRRHGSTIDDRRQAVRDLADVLEYLRPRVQELLTNKDENDLFNIANNFGIRHHNDRQRTNYDTAIWLSWMFYFYLATIHVVLRKIESQSEQETPPQLQSLNAVRQT
jgi:hypothetical protein